MTFIQWELVIKLCLWGLSFPLVSLRRLLSVWIWSGMRYLSNKLQKTNFKLPWNSERYYPSQRPVLLIAKMRKYSFYSVFRVATHKWKIFLSIWNLIEKLRLFKPHLTMTGIYNYIIIIPPYIFSAPFTKVGAPNLELTNFPKKWTLKNSSINSTARIASFFTKRHYDGHRGQTLKDSV